MNSSPKSERTRLARELHDGLAQELSAFGYQLDQVIGDHKLDNKNRGLLRQLRFSLSGIINQVRDEIYELRNENLKRKQGMASASGDENSRSTVLKSSGTSANYRGRIVARIKSNIAFNPDVVNNPLAIVEIRTSPDGTILSYKIITPSGNKSWDDAVLKAIVKTAILPRDEDGHVPPIFEITFRPKD